MFQIYQSLNIKDKSKEELLGAMILHDLKQKAETRQLRNLDLKGTQNLTLEQCRSKLVMLAKDHMNPKKSSGVVYSFIPQIVIELFDKEVKEISKEETVIIIQALNNHIPVKELLKIAEGGYASLLIQLAFHLDPEQVRPLLEKFAFFDNVTFAFILRNPLEHPALDRKLIVELVKHYGAKPEAALHIANLIKSLSSDV